MTLPSSLRRVAEEGVDLEGWRELHAAAPEALRTLVLHGCGLSSLRGAPPALPFLTDLNLSSNGLASFEGFPEFPSLTRLDLSSNALDGTPFKGSPHYRFPALRVLLLPFNGITSLSGVGAACPRLAELDVSGNRLQGDACLRHLRALPSLTTLSLQRESLC